MSYISICGSNAQGQEKMLFSGISFWKSCINPGKENVSFWKYGFPRIKHLVLFSLTGDFKEVKNSFTTSFCVPPYTNMERVYRATLRCGSIGVTCYRWWYSDVIFTQTYHCHQRVLVENLTHPLRFVTTFSKSKLFSYI